MGNSGTGTLTVYGGTISSAHGVVGYVGGTGTATLTGTDSQWNMTGNLTVGYYSGSTGSLVISDGATVSSNMGYIGRSNVVSSSNSTVGTNSVGTVLVTGSGSVWSTGGLRVGNLGTGSLTLANEGMVTVNSGAGTLTLGNNATGNGTLNFGAAATDTAATAGTLNAAAINTASGAGLVQINTTATAANPFNFTSTGTASGTAVNITGATQLVQTAGYTVFGSTGTYSYTGATTINGGTLIMNGSASASDFTVNAGAALGGSGTIGSLALASGSLLSPGNSPGTLTINGDATWSGGAGYTWELNSVAGSAGSTWDLLTVNGTLVLDALTSESPFVIYLTSLTVANVAGLVADFDPTADATFLLVQADNVSGFAASSFILDTSAFANAYTGAWSITQSGNDLVLVYSATAVPEPAVCTLVAGLGCLGLLARRKFRRL